MGKNTVIVLKLLKHYLMHFWSNKEDDPFFQENKVEHVKAVGNIIFINMTIIDSSDICK